MRTLHRNKRKIYYCNLLNGSVEVVDEHGNATLETVPMYTNARALNVNITPASGISATEQFGNLDHYDKVIVLTDTVGDRLLIDESTVFFIDRAPETKVIDCYIRGARGNIEPARYWVPNYDYVIVRIARSINSVSIAVRKVR